MICSDRKEAEIAKNFVPQPSKLEVNEENESENNIENESAPVVTYQMNIYQDWKLICDAYPAIASTCQNGTDVAQNAKRLFMITTAEQRSDLRLTWKHSYLDHQGCIQSRMVMLFLHKVQEQMLLCPSVGKVI